MVKILLKNGLLINRGRQYAADILIDKGRIDRVSPAIDATSSIEIDCSGMWILPGLIDDQVHFREPGLTYKATIYSESRAAVAGGVTSFMEMPNTNPPALTQGLLEDKYRIAARFSAANYSFYMGAGNDNLDEILRTDPEKVCGLKIFMGSSTGNMLVDDQTALENIFSQSPMLIATHCEDEQTIRDNLQTAITTFGEDIPPEQHPVIRSREACYKSSTRAIDLARRHGARLHILHISTREELELFNTGPVTDKKITSEACVHHMFFNDSEYTRLGNKIKCNPAIKTEEDRKAIIEGVKSDRLDIIATDHAPHTLQEKANLYTDAPSGLPLVQHSLNILLDLHFKGELTVESVVEKACHAPAKCFGIKDRGYLDEGMWADIAIVDPSLSWHVSRESLFYKCGWTPLEGKAFQGKVIMTMVNGSLVYEHGHIVSNQPGARLQFNHS